MAQAKQLGPKSIGFTGGSQLGQVLGQGVSPQSLIIADLLGDRLAVGCGRGASVPNLPWAELKTSFNTLLHHL